MPMTDNVVRKNPRAQLPRLQLRILGFAVAVSALVVVWLLVSNDGGKNTTSASNTGATTVSQAQLERLADSIDHPVYWAGPKDNVSYELTQTSDGRIFIRYLPEGVKPGDPRPDFLTVGTYSRSDAYDDLQRAAKRKGTVSMSIDGGGLVVYNSSRPTSVYVGYPKAKYQVEVFSPSGETARRLVLSGQIKPID